MAKESKLDEMETTEDLKGFELDVEAAEPTLQVVHLQQETAMEEKTETKVIKENNPDGLVSCLRNEIIIVRHVPKKTGYRISDPKHVLYGGMADGASVTYTVPRLQSGNFVNVLTDKEKDYLESVMGLEYNALSIYKKVNNFWDGDNENGISSVRLVKGDNRFNLSNPEDYIRYKILLANKDFIAPSLQELQDHPKATYKFVIMSENAETDLSRDKMNVTMMCYKEYGKVETNSDVLRFIIETLDGRPLAKATKLGFLQGKINDLIQANAKMFLSTITDPMLNTKILIRKSVEAGLISKRGDYLYLRKDNSPLCGMNEEPTLHNAAKFLNLPKNQEIKFYLEAQTKE